MFCVISCFHVHMISIECALALVIGEYCCRLLLCISGLLVLSLVVYL